MVMNSELELVCFFPSPPKSLPCTSDTHDMLGVARRWREEPATSCDWMRSSWLLPPRRRDASWDAVVTVGLVLKRTFDLM